MPSCSDSHIFLFSCHFLSGFIFPSLCLKSFENDPVTKQGSLSLVGTDARSSAISDQGENSSKLK